MINSIKKLLTLLVIACATLPLSASSRFRGVGPTRNKLDEAKPGTLQAQQVIDACAEATKGISSSEDRFYRQCLFQHRSKATASQQEAILEAIGLNK